MNAPQKEPGMLTLLEAARLEPPMHTLTLSAGFVDKLCREYFLKASTTDQTFRDDLWNSLEGANSLYTMVIAEGLPSANIAGAQKLLREFRALLEPIRLLGPADFGRMFSGLLVLLWNLPETTSQDLLDRQRMIQNLHDGNRLRKLINEAVAAIDGCLQQPIPDAMPERRNWALRGWCICTMSFWMNRANLKPTLTKLSEPGGVRIKSAIGRFGEECLREIGVEAAYDLRSALTFAKKHLDNDTRLKALIRNGDMDGAADLIEKWKDRFPLTIG